MSTYNARDPGSIPGSGKIPWRRERLPTVVFSCFPCGSAGKEPACNAGDLGLTPELGRSPGEGKGYPLQYSGLENSTDCIVHGVPKSQTWLSNFHKAPSRKEISTSAHHFSTPASDRKLRAEEEKEGWKSWPCLPCIPCDIVTAWLASQVTSPCDSEFSCVPLLLLRTLVIILDPSW